ncbi:MAG TPA: DUF3305 domain-containing protein [Xanthobacteraceae bacterium]
MNAALPHASIPVGVVVERRRATSPWLDVIWRPIAVLSGLSGGLPDTAPWTVLSATADAATFYAGGTAVELYRTETEHYRGNLASPRPSLWIALRPTGAEPPYRLFAVTADPAEGESFTQAGDDLVDAVPMPPAVHQVIAAFVAEHHVEQAFYRRKRDGADGEAPAGHKPRRKDRDL